MANVQAFFISSPCSVFANPRYSVQSCRSSDESTIRAVHSHVRKSSNSARIVLVPLGLQRILSTTSRRSNFASLPSPQGGLIGLTKLSGVTSNSQFSFYVCGRASENHLPTFLDNGIRKPVVSRAAFHKKLEEFDGTVGQGGVGRGGPHDGGGGGDAVDWIIGALIFSFCAGLICFGIILSSDETSYRDIYFIGKLFGFHGDDGVAMDRVWTGEWFMPLTFLSPRSWLWERQGLGFYSQIPAQAEVAAGLHLGVEKSKPDYRAGGITQVGRSVGSIVCRVGGGGAVRWGRSDSLRRDDEEEVSESSGSRALGYRGPFDEDDDDDDYDSDVDDREDEIVGFYDEDEMELDNASSDLEFEDAVASSEISVKTEERESTTALIAQFCERVQAGDGVTVTAGDIADLYEFPFDKFQRMAIDGFLMGSSVVVCAPTSSGKTLIAEAAAVATLARGKRMFYTTPLKALSNQKLREFRKLFGESNVGLLTGDAAVNRDAPILVMTTEILRNMLYQSAGNADDQGGRLENVSAVVLDEVHYLSDISRGTVWEETVIYCPKSVQLICLSATVANPQDLAGWIAQVHGPTELVTSSKRPVPLMWHFSTKYVLLPLLNEQGTEMNYRLSLTDPRQNTTNSSSFWDVDEGGRGRRGGDGRRRSSGNGYSRGSENGSRRRGDRFGDAREELSEETKSMLRRRQVPQVRDTLHQLVARDMLPAIWFIFSRRGCDTAVKYLADSSLLSEDESMQVREAITEFQEHHPEAIRESAVEPLSRGVAAHHAGCLPTWKAFVEELFQKGLVKVVFATETLSAGINMPARTTVLSSLSKKRRQWSYAPLF
ncbi:hypothetical protein Mapa_008480 [Marchantia paleacea]|nr:hypothetical protein Mapa_008480 [Marchantia paleacea]